MPGTGGGVVGWSRAARFVNAVEDAGKIALRQGCFLRCCCSLSGLTNTFMLILRAEMNRIPCKVQPRSGKHQCTKSAEEKKLGRHFHFARKSSVARNCCGATASRAYPLSAHFRFFSCSSSYVFSSLAAQFCPLRTVFVHILPGTGKYAIIFSYSLARSLLDGGRGGAGREECRKGRVGKWQVQKVPTMPTMKATK